MLLICDVQVNSRGLRGQDLWFAVIRRWLRYTPSPCIHTQ